MCTNYFISIVTAFFAGALCLVTIVYARTTWLAYKQDLRRAEPHVVAFLKSTEDMSVIRLYIKNVGNGTANNVRVSALTDHKIFGRSGEYNSFESLLSDGLRVLPPQEEYSCYIDAWSRLRTIEGADKLFIELKVCYEFAFSKNQTPKEETFKLMFKQTFNQGRLNPPETYIGKIAYYAEKINNAICSPDSIALHHN